MKTGISSSIPKADVEFDKLNMIIDISMICLVYNFQTAKCTNKSSHGHLNLSYIYFIYLNHGFISVIYMKYM